MAVKYYTDGTEFKLRGKGRVAEWVAECVRAEGCRLGPVNFVFCGQERHREINRDFLGHDWPTDVITFDYGAPALGASGLSERGEASAGGVRVVSGDIFVDPVTVAENAKDLCVAPEVEMRRVMIHGVLHLCGHGDATEREQRAMRRREDKYLRKFYATI